MADCEFTTKLGERGGGLIAIAGDAHEVCGRKNCRRSSDGCRCQSYLVVV